MAGKFEILSPKFDEAIFEEIKDVIDSYFIKNFFGVSGVSLSYVECKREDFKEPQKYKALRDKISEAVELEKFKKLNLKDQNPILSYDKGITNQTLCKVCNIRKISHNNDKCEVCSAFIKLGERLASDSKKVNSKEIGIDFLDVDLEITENIRSYVAKNEDAIVDFETLARESHGENAIALVKADVDNMGNFISHSDVTQNFANFDTFSKGINNFFSLYVTRKMKDKFKGSYTVFAGGDDLLLVGSYDQMIELAIFIRQEFMKYIKTKDLSISFGLVLAKPSTPISYLAKTGELWLEASKEMDGKDAVSIFGETAKWNSYISVRSKILGEFEKFGMDNTAFYTDCLSFVR
ncbi:MAG: type III-A CRISPR-associated protein Cas10/Csm1 [Wolinella sp.]